jgi:restriction system protein
MLMLYFFTLIIAWFTYEVISRVVHLLYLVKISILVDSIKRKDDLLFLRTKDYEYVIAEVFKRTGYKVRMSSHFGDGGAGLILNDLYYVIARKEAYHHLVEIEQAKKLIKHMQDNNIYRGMIILLGDFKLNTKNLCHIHSIKCINGNQLLQMIKEVQVVKPVSVKLP